MFAFKLFSLAFFTWAAAAGKAVELGSFNLPFPTKTPTLPDNAARASGVGAPGVTQPPSLELELFRRQQLDGFTTVCGYNEGNASEPFTCLSGSYCGFNGQYSYFGCCQTTIGSLLYGCDDITQCLDSTAYYGSCDAACQANTLLGWCTSSQIPYCRRYLLGNYTAYDCGSFSGVTYTLEYYPTGASSIEITSSGGSTQSPLSSSSLSSYSSPTTTGSIQTASSLSETTSLSSFSIAFTQSQVTSSGSETSTVQEPNQSSASSFAPTATATATGNLARPRGSQGTWSLRLWCGLVAFLAVPI